MRENDPDLDKKKHSLQAARIQPLKQPRKEQVN